MPRRTKVFRLRGGFRASMAEGGLPGVALAALVVTIVLFLPAFRQMRWKSSVSVHDTTFFFVANTAILSLYALSTSVFGVGVLLKNVDLDWWLVAFALSFTALAPLLLAAFLAAPWLLLRGSVPAGPGLEAALRPTIVAHGAALGFHKHVRIRESPRTAAPIMLAGPFVEPALLVPAGLEQRPGTTHWLRATLAHELGHLVNGEATWFPGQSLMARALLGWWLVVLAALVATWSFAPPAWRTLHMITVAMGFAVLVSTYPFLNYAYRAREHQADAVAARVVPREELVGAIGFWERKILLHAAAERAPTRWTALPASGMPRIVGLLNHHPPRPRRSRALASHEFEIVGPRPPTRELAIWVGGSTTVLVIVGLLLPLSLGSVGWWEPDADLLASFFVLLGPAFFAAGIGLPVFLGNAGLLLAGELREIAKCVVLSALAALAMAGLVGALMKPIPSAPPFGELASFVALLSASGGTALLLVMLLFGHLGRQSHSPLHEQAEELVTLLVPFVVFVGMPGFLLFRPSQAAWEADGILAALPLLFGIGTGTMAIIGTFHAASRLVRATQTTDGLLWTSGTTARLISLGGFRRPVARALAGAALMPTLGALIGLTAMAALAVLDLGPLPMGLVFFAAFFLVLPKDLRRWRENTVDWSQYRAWDELGGSLTPAGRGGLPHTARAHLLDRVHRHTLTDGSMTLRPPSETIATAYSTAVVGHLAWLAGADPAERPLLDAVRRVLACSREDGGFSLIPGGPASRAATLAAVRLLTSVQHFPSNRVGATTHWLLGDLAECIPLQSTSQSLIHASAVATALASLGTVGRLTEVLIPSDVERLALRAGNDLEAISAAASVLASIDPSGPWTGAYRRKAEALAPMVLRLDPSRQPDRARAYVRLREATGLGRDPRVDQWIRDGLARLELRVAPKRHNA